MMKVTAVHSNGYVRAAFVRQDADVAALVARLEAAGYWLDITVASWEPAPRRRAR